MSIFFALFVEEQKAPICRREGSEGNGPPDVPGGAFPSLSLSLSGNPHHSIVALCSGLSELKSRESFKNCLQASYLSDETPSTSRQNGSIWLVNTFRTFPHHLLTSATLRAPKAMPRGARLRCRGEIKAPPSSYHCSSQSNANGITSGGCGLDAVVMAHRLL